MQRLLHLLLAALFALVLAPLADAELIRIELKEKGLKKYAKHLTEWGGKQVLICEPKDGNINFADGKINYSPQRNEVWIADSGKPEVVPYKLKDGELVPTSKKWVLAVLGDHVKSIQKFSRDGQTFGGLSKEYGIRKEIVDEIVAQRDATAKGSAEWFQQHMRYASALRRLHAWLSNTCYVKAAEKLEKEIEKQEKTIAKEAQEYRLRDALESVKMVETPEALVQASEEITNGNAIFKVQESQHVRIVYVDELTDEVVHGLLELAETAIDSFKVEFVDPYVDVADFRDQIPDEHFIEFFFGPTDHQRSYEKFLEVYYKLDWGKFREKMLEGKMSGHRLSQPHRKLTYAILQENQDMEGTVMHAVGHALASFHYNNGSGFETMAWLREAVGFWISFEMLGRNSTTCFTYHEEEAVKYRKPKKDGDPLVEGEKTVQRGTRDAFNAMALDIGPKLEVMALKTLFELDNADFAKGWSMYDYLCRKRGKQGQQWLRAGCKAGVSKNKLINDWRAASEAIFEVEGIDVFKMVEDEWKAFARTEQDRS